MFETSHLRNKNQVWTAGGWLYLAAVLDLFNRDVVGWSSKPMTTVYLVIDALTMARFRRTPSPSFQPGKATVCVSQAFQALLEDWISMKHEQQFATLSRWVA